MVAKKPNDSNVSCIVSRTVHVLRVKKLICNVLFKNTIRYIQISNLPQFMSREKSKMAAIMPMSNEIWLSLQSCYTY